MCTYVAVESIFYQQNPYYNTYWNRIDYVKKIWYVWESNSEFVREKWVCHYSDADEWIDQNSVEETILSLDYTVPFEIEW